MNQNQKWIYPQYAYWGFRLMNISNNIGLSRIMIISLQSLVLALKRSTFNYCLYTISFKVKLMFILRVISQWQLELQSRDSFVGWNRWRSIETWTETASADALGSYIFLKRWCELRSLESEIDCNLTINEAGFCVNQYVQDGWQLSVLFNLNKRIKCYHYQAEINQNRLRT